MRNIQRTLCLILAAGLLSWGGCGSSSSNPPADPNPPGTQDPAEPAFSASLFSSTSDQVDNAYFPLTPGLARTFRVETEDGVEIIVVETLDTTRTVAGVKCAIVRDQVFLDELLIEDTFDWYAQDDDGNVWYLGEDVTNYEYDDDGNLLGTDDEGAWEAGVDGAVAGILMKATQQVGDTYRQEYYEGEAEDMGEIIALNVSVLLSTGAAYTCLQTRDWNPLEPGSEEFKYYAPGLGVVLEEPTDGSEQNEYQGAFDTTEASLPDIDDATFSSPTNVTNPWLSYLPGGIWEYENDTEDGLETILVEVQVATRMVMGIECLVVRDRVYLDGLLIEDTFDWYAQDDDGNVWYMGEDVTNYEYDDMDVLIGTDNDGAWEAGVDGAEPGIIMWATPTVGTSYRQEFYEDEAEDMATVIATGVTVVLEEGSTYLGCVQVLEWSPLAPEALEYKFYESGVGVVLELPLHADERVELTGP